MTPMKLGAFTFDDPIFLAPMAGVTDTAYRVIAHGMGCPLAFAEMVSSQGIHYRNEHTMNMLRTEPEERPIAMQIFAKSAAMAAEAAAYIEALGTADILDFNMGCPAPKRAEEILTAIRRATRLPFTVKMRLGWDDASRNAVEIARMAEAVGVDAVAVHGRTREQFYSGNADYAAIAKVKRAVRIPVIVSGDVRRPADLKRALEITGADAVMIGRGAQGNPWIFPQLIHWLHTGEELPPPTLAERAAVILRHLDLLVGYKGEYIGIREMRKHAAWYTRGLKGSAELRERFNRAASRTEFAEILHGAWGV